VPVSDYTPNVKDVADFIPARTKTRGGAEAGTFNPAASDERDQTRPTAEQIEEKIQKALGKVSGVIGVDVVSTQWEAAKSVTALWSAMLTELGFWPEQVNSGRSAYTQLKELFDEAWGDLLNALGISTDAEGAVPADAGYASYGGFPTTAIGMETPW
jgi:hypothetical protein